MEGRSWELETDGVEVLRGLLSREFLARLGRGAPAGKAGVRNPLQSWPEGGEAAREACRLLEGRFGGTPILTRAILFDKRADANWHLPLHQDRTIAVRERREMPGFGPWSVKAGIHHVVPPGRVLDRMTTVRIHLDDADASSGCLRVVPGSHRRGLLDDGAFDPSPACGTPIEVCAGDAVLMRPLVLHGSERSRSGAARRVLHLEFAFEPLPAPLAWNVVDFGG